MAASWLGLKKFRAGSFTYEVGGEPALVEGSWLEGEAGWKVAFLALSVCPPFLLFYQFSAVRP